jgi:hypothetical protein
MSKITPEEAKELTASISLTVTEVVAMALTKAITKPITEAVTKAVTEVASRPEPVLEPVMLPGNYAIPDNGTWKQMGAEEKRAALNDVITKASEADLETIREQVMLINEFYATRH